MLRPRIIPCLLLHDKGLVKTVKFKEGKYVGDPLNAVKIFNEKAVDELMFLDIDASVEGRGPDFELIKNLAMESNMPICYGGGVKSVEHAKRIISLGAEKVAISSAAVEDISIVSRMAEAVGSQSVVVVIDVKQRGLFNKLEVVTHNAKKSTGLHPVEFAIQCEKAGAGEIVINNVDEDGEMKGYNIKMLKEVRSATTIPMTALGGAGALSDISSVIKEVGNIGVAAGSLFVFKGKYKAVLINYPNKDEKSALLADAGWKL